MSSEQFFWISPIIFGVYPEVISEDAVINCVKTLNRYRYPYLTCVRSACNTRDYVNRSGTLVNASKFDCAKFLDNYMAFILNEYPQLTSNDAELIEPNKIISYFHENYQLELSGYKKVRVVDSVLLAQATGYFLIKNDATMISLKLSGFSIQDAICVSEPTC